MLTGKPNKLVLSVVLNREVLLTAPIEEQHGTVELKKADGSTWQCVTAKQHETLLRGAPVSLPLWTGSYVVVKPVTSF